MMNIKGIAFDLEGTCIDLEVLHFAAYKQVLAQMGIDMDVSELWSIPGAVGGGSRYIAQVLQCKYKDKDFSDFPIQKKVLYEKMVADAVISPREGLVEALELIRGLSIPVALGSRTVRSQGEYLLAKSGLDAYFTDANTVFLEDVQSSKPAPDVYIKTALIMGIDNKEQLIFEDSVVGIVSGKASASPVIAIPSPVCLEEEHIQELEEAGAQTVLYSWNEVTQVLLESV